MYKFNDSTIVSGYIKQLLSTFHLPKARVYGRDNYLYIKERDNEKQQLKQTLAYIKTALKRPDLTPAVKVILEKQESTIENRLDQLDTSAAELNIIPTVYRNNYEKYPIGGKTTNPYPIHLTYVPYIKDGLYQEYVYDENKKTYKWVICHKQFNDETHEKVHVNGGLYETHKFFYNKYDRNFTRQLAIRNNIYDSYTHEYLGEYLRFQRDYNNLDLMPLYNCFSNASCSNINVSITPQGASIASKFNSRDEDYKIYMIPVKMFQKYTIAIESEVDIEMFCGVFGSYLDENTNLKDLPKLTYACINNSKFSVPVLYDKLVNIGEQLGSQLKQSILGQKERDLKLFIKVPVDNKSSIVVLEGDYRTYNDFTFEKDGTTFKKIYNKSVTNFEYPIAINTFKPITSLQLLRQNTGESYPFADRLLEYLVGSAITHLDDIGDNVKRVKTAIKYNISDEIDLDIDELWSPELAPIIYEYMSNNKYSPVGLSSYAVNHDLLGFVDRDVERLYHYDTFEIDPKTKEKSFIGSTSIAEVDLYVKEDGKYEWN